MSSLSSDSSATSTKVKISRGTLDEIAAFGRFIEDLECDLDLACDLACDLVEKTGGQQEGGDDDLKEVICVT